MITKSIIFALVALCLVSCDQLTGADTGANKSLLDKVVGGVSFVEVSPVKILLSGSMDNGGDSSHNFEAKLQLLDGKKGKLHFFANKTLNSGISVDVEKVNSNAKITVSLNGVSHTVLQKLSDDNILHLSLDLHNDHEDAHILIWDAAGPFDDSEECVDEETCIYNTEFFTDPNPGPWGSQGKGAGSFWGYEGDREIILELVGPLRAISNA